MESVINEILKYGEFTDKIYNILVAKYDKETVDKVIMNVIRSNDKNSRIYKILLSDSNKRCYSVINSIYIMLLSEIANKLNAIFIEIGCKDNRKFLSKNMSTKIDIALGKCSDKDKVVEIRNLYNQFVVLRNKIFNGNVGLIKDVLSRFDSIDNKEEAYQEASFGLIRAIEKYDSSKGMFSTFANDSIFYAILGYLYNDNNNYFYMPHDIRIEYFSVAKLLSESYSKYGIYPDDMEIIDKTGLSLDKINFYKLVYNYNNRSVSVDDRVLIDGEESTLIDSYYNSRLDNTDVEQDVFDRDLSSIINGLVEDMPEKCRYIVKGFFYDEKSLHSLAREMNLTLSRVSAMRSAGLSRVRKNYKKFINYL